MYEMPNSRIRTALIRIADALCKEPLDPADAKGDVVAYSLERIVDTLYMSDEEGQPDEEEPGE